jgi:hypothetical protein
MLNIDYLKVKAMIHTRDHQTYGVIKCDIWVPPKKTINA